MLFEHDGLFYSFIIRLWGRRRRRRGISAALTGVQGGGHFRDRPVTIFRGVFQPLQQRRRLRRGQQRGQRGGRGIVLVLLRLLRFLHPLAGNHVIQRGAVGVHIAPRADLAAGEIHLHRGKAPLDDQRLRGAAALDHRFHRAEIQQLRRAAFGDHDVVRADVPVDEAAGMDLRQRFRDGGQQLHRLPVVRFFRELFQIGGQRDALHEFHDDIGGVVLLKIVLHPHDVGDIVQPRQRLRLVDAFADAGGKALLEVLGGIAADDAGPDRFTPYEARREILLDGDPDLQGHIIPGVGDAEAALSQRPADDVPVFQNDAVAQVMRLRRVGGVVEPAPLADRRPVQRGKAIEAALVAHTRFSSFSCLSTIL